MKSYWVKRIVRLLILLFGVSILCFVLTALSSTDPATYIIRRGNLSPTPEAIEQIRVELGLDQPLPIRYFNWIGGVLHGDFGESIFSTNDVAADLARYFPQTLQLVALSLAEIIVFSILLGVLCAAKKNKLTDHIMRIVSMFGICVPPFWLGFLLLIGFAVEIPIFSVTPAPGIMGLILPSITLSFPAICSTVRVFRASLLEEMHRDYVSFARANGMSVKRILWEKGVSQCASTGYYPVLSICKLFDCRECRSGKSFFHYGSRKLSAELHYGSRCQRDWRLYAHYRNAVSFSRTVWRDIKPSAVPVEKGGK